MTRQLEEYQLIERSIIKKYRKEIWNPFIEGVKRYKLINESDRIEVRLSESKSSVLMAKLLQQLQRVSETNFELVFVCSNKEAEDIAARVNIPTEVDKIYCNKIAVEDNFSDVIETLLFGMLYDSKIESVLPKESSKEGIKIIRPLYCVRREIIDAWCKYNNLELADDKTEHAETKQLISELRKNNPDVERNIFKSFHAVCLDTMPGYRQNGKEHSFLEKY